MASGIPAVYTGIMVGGLVLTVLAIAGCWESCNSCFTPRIVTVIFNFDCVHADTVVILKLVLETWYMPCLICFSR